MYVPMSGNTILFVYVFYFIFLFYNDHGTISQSTILFSDAQAVRYTAVLE